MTFQKNNKIRLGILHTKESKEKMRLSKLGKKNPKSSETKKRLFKEGKLILYNKGKTLEQIYDKEKVNEIKNKMSETRKRLFRERKLISPNKGKKGLIHRSEEYKKKQSLMESGKGNPFYGKHHTEETKNKISLKNRNKHRSEEVKKILGNNSKLRWQNPDFKRKMKIMRKNLWQNPEYRKKQLKAILSSVHQKPNKAEQKLDSILQTNFPNEFKFVGDGQVIIEGFNPDFIDCNGKKLIIELYGEYHHNLPKRIISDKRKLEIYDKYGYKTLIIWSKELKQPELIEKVKGFING